MRLTVFDQEGGRHELTADDNAVSVMEVIRAEGLSITAQCGGSASCATCHVYVDAAWVDKLPAMSAEEKDMLEIAVDPKPESRLSCQLKPGPELDGLVVTLAPGTEF